MAVPSLQEPIPAVPCQHCLCEGRAGVLDPSAPGGPPQTDQCIPWDRGWGREEARQEQGQGGSVPAGPVCGGRGGAEGGTAGAHCSCVRHSKHTPLPLCRPPPACAPWGLHHTRTSGPLRFHTTVVLPLSPLLIPWDLSLAHPISVSPPFSLILSPPPTFFCPRFVKVPSKPTAPSPCPSP